MITSPNASPAGGLNESSTDEPNLRAKLEALTLDAPDREWRKLFLDALGVLLDEDVDLGEIWILERLVETAREVGWLA